MKQLLSCILALALLSACTKGREVLDPYYISLSINTLTADPLNCQVFLNGEAQYPYMSNGSMTKKLMFRDSGIVNIRIEEVPSRKVLVQESYRPAFGSKLDYVLTVYQGRTGETPYLLLPDVSEPAPPAGTAKWQLTYNGTNLPDSVKMRFYFNRNNSPKDSCMVGRYGFSNWAVLRMYADSSIQYDVLNGNTNAVLYAKRTWINGVADLPVDDYYIFKLDKNSLGDPEITRCY